MARKRYLFTNKKTPERGLFSAFLGLISLLGVLGALLVSYHSKGTVSLRLGAVVFLSVFFAVTGVILGLLSHEEPDMFTFFPKLGIVLNILTILLAGFILYMGV